MTNQYFEDRIQCLLDEYMEKDPEGAGGAFLAGCRALYEDLAKQKPVGVFTNVNKLAPEQGDLWQQMVDDAYDGVDYVYLYAYPPDSATRITELEAEVAELKQCQQWQPIETAPKGERGYAWMRLAWGSDEDKNTGDGFYAEGKFFAAACFSKLSGSPAFEYRQIEVTPTHWMPLPDAPAVDAAKGGE